MMSRPEQSAGRPWSLVTASVPIDNYELTARISIITEQLVMAQAEVVLRRAAFDRICEEESAARPWMRAPLESLSIPRVGRALSARLAAIERFRLWATELDWLQREARSRGLLRFPD